MTKNIDEDIKHEHNKKTKNPKTDKSKVKNSKEKETIKDQETDETAEEDVFTEDINLLKQELEKKQKEVDKYKNLLLRSKADLENYRKRARRDIQNASLFAGEELVKDILPVVDNFERALSSVKDKSNSVYKGIKLIYQQFIDLLEKHNIKEIKAEGKPFDPKYHQAVMQVEIEEVESNTVVDVIQKGYLYNSKVIRPSMVKVAKN